MSDGVMREGEATPSAALLRIYDEIGVRVAGAIEAYPAWPCRRGCDACCRRLANVPEMTGAEWELLREGMEGLPEAVRAEVEARIVALGEREAGAEGWVVCPFLDEAEGACRVYEYRPAACRMYGFYVGRDNNQWCGDIQALDDAGALDGVMLGNHDAVSRELRRGGREVRGVDVWFLRP